MIKQKNKHPIWIVVGEGEEILFEGHQGHWADCFFSNSYEEMIRHSLDSGELFQEVVPYLIREMTEEEVLKYPEAIDFRQKLIEEYGTD